MSPLHERTTVISTPIFPSYCRADNITESALDYCHYIISHCRFFTRSVTVGKADYVTGDYPTARATNVLWEQQVHLICVAVDVKTRNSVPVQRIKVLFTVNSGTIWKQSCTAEPLFSGQHVEVVCSTYFHVSSLSGPSLTFWEHFTNPLFWLPEAKSSAK